ncbi:hypothetical protein PCH_Pc21g22130 [Penicillium rubens Wisconsin 54-1255]|uniref:Uncharacterized protein n=1 Tax=Penicillium rubens (strain ATCC 28089 / DSM 1075 / NRRL 1951 / Wisconsin 54-1255) TaxID=500485 RepID=B6HMZ4_PENRW|nr:hypothetical protein PCH_Pc21g22130 [Penicillium rubens Wisconsin 54-1255]
MAVGGTSLTSHILQLVDKTRLKDSRTLTTYQIQSVENRGKNTECTANLLLNQNGREKKRGGEKRCETYWVGLIEDLSRGIWTRQPKKKAVNTEFNACLLLFPSTASFLGFGFSSHLVVDDYLGIYWDNQVDQSSIDLLPLQFGSTSARAGNSTRSSPSTPSRLVAMLRRTGKDEVLYKFSKGCGIRTQP